MNYVLNLKNYKSKNHKLICDSNILIQYADGSHSLNKYVRPEMRRLINDKITFCYPYFCLREFREYFRKQYLKNYLIGYIQTKTLGPKTDLLINNLNNSLIARDRDFKNIRDQIEAENLGLGYALWFLICKNALEKKMLVVEEFINNSNFVNIEINNTIFFNASNSLSPPNINTENYYTLNYGIGTVDSALVDWVNRIDCIDGLFTNDHDILTIQIKGTVKNKIFYTTLSKY